MRLDERLALSPEETFERLGLGRTSGWKLLLSGRLRSVKVGRRRLVPMVAIEEFLGAARPEGEKVAAG